MGNETGLEVLKNGAKIFASTNSIIKDGYAGAIFRASNGDLYVMGNGTGLEVLKNGASDFVSVPETITTNGSYGVIFQTDNGDLYVMGYGTGLEVLKNNTRLSFDKTDETAKGKNDGTITVTNGTDAHSQLQYKLSGSSTWINVDTSGRVINLAPGTYQFQWVGKNGEQYVGGISTSKPISTTVIIVPETKIAVPITPTFDKTDETAKDKNDGIITVTNGTDTHSHLQYKLADDSNWINVPNNGKITSLAPGTYQFQWVGKNNEQYVGGTSTSKPISTTVIIVPETKIAIPATVPVFNKTDETAKGKNDGTITVTNGTDTYSQLQYKLSSSSNTWNNVPNSGRITSLVPGIYQFQWKSKNNEQYINTSKITINIGKKVVIKTKKIASNKNQTIILATTIPIAFIVILATILLIKYKPFRSNKK